MYTWNYQNKLNTNQLSLSQNKNYDDLIDAIGNSYLKYNKNKSQLTIDNILIPNNNSENSTLTLPELDEIYYHHNQRYNIKNNSNKYRTDLKYTTYNPQYDNIDNDLLAINRNNKKKILPKITKKSNKKNIPIIIEETHDDLKIDTKINQNYQKNYITEIPIKQNKNQDNNIQNTENKDTSEKKKNTSKKWWIF